MSPETGASIGPFVVAIMTGCWVGRAGVGWVGPRVRLSAAGGRAVGLDVTI